MTSVVKLVIGDVRSLFTRIGRHKTGQYNLTTYSLRYRKVAEMLSVLKHVESVYKNYKNRGSNPLTSTKQVG